MNHVNWLLTYITNARPLNHGYVWAIEQVLSTLVDSKYATHYHAFTSHKINDEVTEDNYTMKLQSRYQPDQIDRTLQLLVDENIANADSDDEDEAQEPYASEQPFQDDQQHDPYATPVLNAMINEYHDRHKLSNAMDTGLTKLRNSKTNLKWHRDADGQHEARKDYSCDVQHFMHLLNQHNLSDSQLSQKIGQLRKEATTVNKLQRHIQETQVPVDPEGTALLHYMNRNNRNNNKNTVRWSNNTNRNNKPQICPICDKPAAECSATQIGKGAVCRKIRNVCIIDILKSAFPDQPEQVEKYTAQFPKCTSFCSKRAAVCPYLQDRARELANYVQQRTEENLSTTITHPGEAVPKGASITLHCIAAHLTDYQPENTVSLNTPTTEPNSLTDDAELIHTITRAMNGEEINHPNTLTKEQLHKANEYLWINQAIQEEDNTNSVVDVISSPSAHDTPIHVNDNSHQYTPNLNDYAFDADDLWTGERITFLMQQQPICLPLDMNITANHTPREDYSLMQIAQLGREIHTHANLTTGPSQLITSMHKAATTLEQGVSKARAVQDKHPDEDDDLAIHKCRMLIHSIRQMRSRSVYQVQADPGANISVTPKSEIIVGYRKIKPQKLKVANHEHPMSTIGVGFMILRDIQKQIQLEVVYHCPNAPWTIYSPNATRKFGRAVGEDIRSYMDFNDTVTDEHGNELNKGHVTGVIHLYNHDRDPATNYKTFKRTKKYTYATVEHNYLHYLAHDALLPPLLDPQTKDPSHINLCAALDPYNPSHSNTLDTKYDACLQDTATLRNITVPRLPELTSAMITSIARWDEWQPPMDYIPDASIDNPIQFAEDVDKAEDATEKISTEEGIRSKGAEALIGFNSAEDSIGSDGAEDSIGANSAEDSTESDGAEELIGNNSPDTTNEALTDTPHIGIHTILNTEPPQDTEDYRIGLDNSIKLHIATH